MNCAKYGCPNRPEHRLTVVVGCTISVCHTHLAWARQVIDTGRP